MDHFTGRLPFSRAPALGGALRSVANAAQGDLVPETCRRVSAGCPAAAGQGCALRPVRARVDVAELPVTHCVAGYARSAVSLPIRVFVAMSFREDEEPALADYWHAMQRATQRVGADFELRRLSDIDGDFDIAERIYQEIDEADFLIADLTLSPANVYLEIGYARGRGKRVIQMCREGTSLEFDLRGRRTLTYRNATILEEKLFCALDAMLCREQVSLA